MIVVDVEQNSPEWLAERCGKATASDFDCILAKGKGITRGKYLSRLAVERLRGSPIGGGFSSQATKNGQEREPEAVALYEVRHSVWVDRVGFCRHDTLQLGASPDGLIGEDGCVEAKCPGLDAHLEYLRLPAGEAPSTYKAQIQGVMWVCGRKWCDFISYSPDMPAGPLQLVVRRVLRDQRYIDMLTAECRVFLDEVAELHAELVAMAKGQG